LVAIRARLARRPFDIVEAHIAFPTGLVALLAAVVGGGRVVLFAHGVDVRELAWRNGIATVLARSLFRRVDLVVANSWFTAAQVERLGPLRRDPAVISPGVVLPASSEPVPDIDRAGILYVGRLIPEKGVRELMLAVAALPPPRPPLTVVGDGPLRPELEAMASSLPIKAAFLGPLRPIDVARQMERAAIVAVPSVYDEPLGLVPIEAMAHGAIVVASRIGGLTETVDDGRNGIRSEPGDVLALTAALRLAIAVLGTPSAYAMRTAGLQTARLHDINRSVALTLEAYRRLERLEAPA
jgi:glycosyltransferase involved in cell wall biosynthesis